MTFALLKAYEPILLEQIEDGLRQSNVDLQPLEHFRRRRLALFWRGYRVMREQAISIYGTIPSYFWASFSPEDAGVGCTMQRAIYHALGGQKYNDRMCFLGGLFNAIIGLIDKFTDNFSDFLPIVQETLNAHSLDALLQLSKPAQLPRPNLSHAIQAETATQLELLLTLIEAYVTQATTLANQTGRQVVWDDFRSIYVELMRHQFASATLAQQESEPTLETLTTAIGRTAPTVWAYFVNACLAGDTSDVERRALYRAPVDDWGKAVVLSEDLCDLLVDLSEGRWNTVTLFAALEFHVSLSPEEVQKSPVEALQRVLEAKVPKRVTRLMCNCYRNAFSRFEALAPGYFHSLELSANDVLSYPLFAKHMIRPELAQDMEMNV